MFVAAARVELHVHGSQSLKQKRGVLSSIKQRVRNKFNVSIAEVGGQDTWQVAVLGLAAVAEEGQDARQRLEAAIDFIVGLHLAEVTDQEVEIL
ncbi:MAG TPA: DUF503 domain-containing protein [Myxococcota bacterium]|nr:DUF503 domain-containing protein [Myxococcota bacterium]